MEADLQLQGSLARPTLLRATIQVSWQSSRAHSLCKISVVEGRHDSQLGLWMGPGPDWRNGLEMEQWLSRTAHQVGQRVRVEYFDREPF